MSDNNIGQTGPESIRINKRKISDLPLGQGNQAKEGFYEFLKTHKQTLISNIEAKFPSHKEEYLNSRVIECERNIKNIKNFKKELKDKIAEYNRLIKDSMFRDKELSKYDINNEADKKFIKELKLKYPPYDVDALNQQIEQFTESIDLCDSVIEQEYDSMSEIKELLALVKQKNKEISNV